MEYEEVKFEPDDCDCLEEEATSPSSVGNELEHLISLPGKHGKIRRPPNAFMLFAREHRRIISETHPFVPNKQISSILGNKWRNLDPSLKSKYYTKAKALDDAHKQHYPNYVYNPKEARERKKSRQMLKRNRKLQGLSKFGKDRPCHPKNDMTDSYFEDSKNSSYGSIFSKNDNNNSTSPYRDANPVRKVSPGYVVPEVYQKYPLVNAMDDPPTEPLAGSRQHMLKFLSDNSSTTKHSEMQNNDLFTHSTHQSSSHPTACNNADSCNFRTSSPVTSSSSEPLVSKNQVHSDCSFPPTADEALNSSKAQVTIGNESKPQNSPNKTPEHRCKCLENPRASTSFAGLKTHCSCPVPPYSMFEGSVYHPPTPPIPHHYYNRPYMSPYMANPYNVHSMYPMSYIPLNQASSEIPPMMPGMYHTPSPTVYHASGPLYGPRCHPYLNGEHLPGDNFHQRFSPMPCRMTEFLDRGENRCPSYAGRCTEAAIAEDDENKDDETERPPSNSSLNNSSSNLVIVTENLENN